MFTHPIFLEYSWHICTLIYTFIVTHLLSWQTLYGILLGILMATFFEWTFHRYFMHKVTFGWRYPFRSHALVHHGIFKADHSYHLKDPKDRKTIPMAWWNGAALTTAANIPFFIGSLLSGKWGYLIGGIISIAAYYVTYERIHWCMHLPKNRVIERSGIFFRLNGHHLLHHRYMHKNFNVVLPLADLLLGTLLLRSKVCFPQARGKPVPDVQPRIS